MKHIRNIFVILLFLGHLSSFANIWSPGAIELIKEEALKDGKYIFLDFYADWCMPCKTMEVGALADQRVKKLLKEKFISKKVNIEDFDGFTLKSEYNVTVLPTFIILNEKGDKVIARYEESMGIERFYNMLQKHAPEGVFPSAPLPSVSSDNYDGFDAPSPSFNEPVIPEIPSVPELEIPETTSTPSSSSKFDEINNGALYEIVSDKLVKTGYSVQIGSFTDFRNVVIESAKYRKKYNCKTLYHTINIDGVPYFRVLLGHFNDKYSAKMYLKRLKNEGLKDGYVQNLKKLDKK